MPSLGRLGRLAEGVLTRVAVISSVNVLGVWRRVGVNVRDVKEAVLVFVLLVDRAHESGGGREHLIDEDEDGLLGRELDALADHVDELAHGEVRGDEVLLLVDGSDVRLLDLLADDLFAMSVSC